MQSKIQEVIITVSAFALLIMLAISAMAIASKFVPKSSPMITRSAERSIYAEIVVEPGDTLWSIARMHLPNEDPRDVVGGIRKLNELTSAEIFPGQVLTIETKQVIEPVRFANGQIH